MTICMVFMLSPADNSLRFRLGGFWFRAWGVGFRAKRVVPEGPSTQIRGLWLQTPEFNWFSAHESGKAGPFEVHNVVIVKTKSCMT